MFGAGHMNFFNVDHCGLYKVGKSQTHGCELGETFDLIMDWVKDRPLSLTIPWDPAQSRNNKSKSYCKDIYKDPETGDFLLVLWKSDTDNAGTLWGASEDKKTGSTDVVKYTNTYKGSKVIWGRPCYYWVLPRYNAVISIKFDHSVCDAQLFEDYVIGCINNRVKHPNRKKEFTEQGFVRISYQDKENQGRYQYRFGISLKSLNTSNSQLSELAKKVTHIIRRETILVDAKDARAEWVKKFSDYVPYVGAKPKAKKRKIEVKAEAKPTSKEIKEIIEKNAQENRKSHEWDNVGFATENGVTWVDKYRLKDIVNISGTGEDYLSAEKLYDAIKKNMSRYIEPLKQEVNKASMVVEENMVAENKVAEA
ncbi:hypothetical protein C3B51_17910 [Pseudoalteromonas rubra]|uniref:Uncharacterized protein n=1 Tax=Pseudoalteromonas rubra TaxID=43658 RepID=A0A4Q7E355_9GAMM|nr:hypothetical protein [Pseudoalteromonas rubra]RZM76441.1 hypothetical protein C3B51_17910 [Pseudoalteromonas rubra]